MPITNVELTSAGISGSATGGDAGSVARSYQAQYRVDVTSDIRSVSWIFAHFQQTPDLPYPGRFFNIAGGYDVFSICKSLNAKYTDKSDGQFIVDVSYESSQGQQQQQQQDDNGKSQTNPLLWADEIDISYYQISIPVEAGQFVGFDPPNIQNRFLRSGQISPIVNSAMTPFDPTLEDEAEIKVLRISKYSKTAQAEAFNDYIGSINGDDVVINKPRYGYRDRFGRFRGRIKGLNAAFAITNGVPHFRQTIEVHITPLLYGWFRPVIDRGVMPRRAAGDPDGSGGTISPGDLVSLGLPTSGIMQDSNGVPLSEPVLFDGNGQPLKTQEGARPVVMVWNLRKIRPFSVIRW